MTIDVLWPGTLSYHILCFLGKQVLRNCRKACFYGLFPEKSTCQILKDSLELT